MPGTQSIIWFVVIAVVLFWFGRYAWQYGQDRRNPGSPAPLATGDKLYDAYTAALEKIKSRWMSARAAPADDAPPPAPEAATPDPVVASSPVPELPLTPSAAQQTSVATVTHTGQVFLPDQPGMRRISHVQISLDIAEGSSVHVLVGSVPGSDAPVVQHFVSPYPGGAIAAPAAKPADATRLPVWHVNNAWRTQVSAAAAPVSAALTRAGAALASRHISLEWALFGIGMVVYLITRLWTLDKFPIYFFADEASNSLFAQDLIARGFRDAKGSWFPIYFDAAANRWTPLLSVYVHAISVGLFGKSIIVARATSAVVSLLAVVAVSLILKRVFKARFWWVGALLLAVTPAWFLHSRTAFETVMMVSFYACFLLCYMFYRTESPRYAYGALLFGAAAFYTYSNGQVVVAALAVMLLVSDFRYHAQQWRKLLPAVGLAVALALPAIVFRFNHPTAAQDHLHTINSFLFQDVSIQQKIVYLAQTYLYGLNPAYWFFPNDHDLVRHIMKGYGHINTQFLPFAALGLGICLWRFRSSPHRAVVLAALAAPAGAALVGVSITRVLAFIPPAIVMVGIGLDPVLSWLAKRIPQAALAVALCAGLSLGGIYMLRQTMVDAPLWFSNYGLYGMQYGAKQLFVDTIPDYLAQDPTLQIGVSSTWANGANEFLDFFFTPEQRPRVSMLSVGTFLDEKNDMPPNLLMVMTPDEFGKAQASPKFKSVTVDKVLPYPDGTPGFYFVRLAYADNVDEIFAAERVAMSKPVEQTIDLWGQRVTVRYSRIDAGQLSDIFDGERFTLMRGAIANPFIIEFEFSQPRPVTGLSADFGSMDFRLTAQLYGVGSTVPVTYDRKFLNLPFDPHIDMSFDSAPALVSRVHIVILNLQDGDTANIHIREILLK